MPKVPKVSKKKLPSTPVTKDGTNKRGRKNKGQDEKKSESTVSDVRQGGPKEEVLVKKTRKKKEVVPEGPRTFNYNDLRDGDKFTFLAPGKGKKTYTCTVQGSEILFERNDKHTYTRHLSEMIDIIKSCHLECTLIQ
jgi:hypothetical protein